MMRQFCVTSFAMVWLCASTALGVPLETRIDLDGDGRPEKIRVQQKQSGYTLSINKARFEEENSEKTVTHLARLDIDKKDGRYELQVLIELDGGYLHNDLYAYDGRQIVQLGGLTGSLNVSGSGRVYVQRWHGNFATTARYQLTGKPRKFTETRQDLYFVGLKATVRKTFPIRLQRHEPKSLIYVSPDSELQLVAVDLTAPDCGGNHRGPCEVLLIHTSTGLTGWVERSTFEEHVQGLPSAG